MQWREIWRLYLTPGDGLLILLLEEFVNHSPLLMIFHFAPWGIFYTSRKAIICLGQETILGTDGAGMFDPSHLNKRCEAHSKDLPQTGPHLQAACFGSPLSGDDKLPVFSSIN